MTTLELMQQAKTAAPCMAAADTSKKNNALVLMAQALLLHTQEILEANAQDLDAARGTISDVMLDRLSLTAERIASMAQGILEVSITRPRWQNSCT